MPRVSVEYRTNSKEVYKRFCDEYPEIKISFKKWGEILRTYNTSFRDYILETGEVLKMSWGFGDFTVSKKKPKRTKEHNGKTYINLPIDWKKTKEQGKYIYQLNTHTDGYKFKWYWFRKEARFYCNEIWVFKPSRLTSRRLAEYINRKNKNYSELYKEWSTR